MLDDHVADLAGAAAAEPRLAVEDEAAADAGAPEDAEQRLVGPAGAEVELGLGGDLDVVADLDRGAELLARARARAGRCRPSRAGSAPGKRSRCARSTSPGEPTPTPASALGLDARRLRRLRIASAICSATSCGAAAGRASAGAPRRAPATCRRRRRSGSWCRRGRCRPGRSCAHAIGRAGPGSAGSGRWWSCRGRARARRRPAARGRSAWRATLPSSTPHWSKESMPQIAPWVKTLCSYSATSEPRVCGREPLGEDRVRGAVALEDAVRDELARACPPRAPRRRSCRRRAPRSGRRRWPSAGRGARRAG